MNNAWFTSDFHFDHKNICGYSNRPFPAVEVMNTAIIDNINAKVARKDVLYFLGDFSFNHKRIREFRERINCVYIRFIYGNHDDNIRNNAENRRLFEWCKDYEEIKVGEQVIILHHYAYQVWNKQKYGSINLFGHSHGNLPDNPNLLSMDVGVDPNNFQPLSFEDVREAMSQKVWKAVDDHVPKYGQ